MNSSETKLDFASLVPRTRAALRDYLAGDYDLLADYFDNPTL